MQNDEVLWQALLQIVLILINAVFSAAEIALISINEAKAEKKAAEGDRRAQCLVALKEQPENFLAAIQVVITLAGFLGSAFAASNFSDELTGVFLTLNWGISQKALSTISLVVITLIISFITIVFGELVPKRLAMKKAEQLAYVLADFISFTTKIFAPIIWMLSKTTNGILKLLGIDPKSAENEVTEEEIRLMLDAGSAKGFIEETEKEIINNVFEFDNRNAGNIMTHRLETIILSLKESDKIWEKTIIESRHQFYPVCGETADDITGVLSTRDFLLLNSYDRKTVLAKAVHNAQFVPESLKTDILFEKMKQSGNHFAIVLDEYGGFSGVITMNDLLESIVGKFC